MHSLPQLHFKVKGFLAQSRSVTPGPVATEVLMMHDAGGSDGLQRIQLQPASHKT